MPRRLPLLLGLSLALVAPLASGCAGTLEPVVNFDAQTDFSSHTTFAWVTDEPIMRRAEGAEQRIYNEKNEKLLREAIELELTSKGMMKVDRASANTLVHFLVMTKQVNSVSQAGGLGYGMTWSNEVERASYVEGTLVVVLFDAATSREIWSGSVSRAIVGGSDPKEVIDTAVIAALTPFPPE